MRHPLVIGNWKLNGNKNMVNNFITSLLHQLSNMINCCDVAIAPPMIYLDIAKSSLTGSSITLGAQNVDLHISGAFTGEISAQMLKDIGAKYIIIGHCERRIYHKENDNDIANKFAIIKHEGLIPVLCIGENKEENETHKTQAICVRQLNSVLNKVGDNAFEHSVIAYEPIWAINTGKSANPLQIQKIHEFIRSYLSNYNQAIAEQVVIQYGGSVNASNAAELFTQPDIDGALVGGSSLKADSFATIIKVASQVKNSLC